MALRDGSLIDAEVVATCDIDGARAKSLGELCGASFVTSDPGCAIDAAEAVWICTPTSNHADLVHRVAAAGRALYLEKPLAPDLRAAEEISKAVQAAGIPNQVGLVLRSSPPVAALAELISQASLPTGEDLGVPMAAVLRDDQFFPIQGMYQSRWRSQVSVSGGGTLIEHSIHDIDMLLWLFGKASSLTARKANHAGYPGIEDVATVTLTHESGVISTLASVWHAILTRPSTRRLEIFTSDAMCVLKDEMAGPIRLQTSSGELEIGMPKEAVAVISRLAAPEPLKLSLLAYAMADMAFLTALSTGAPPEPGIDVGLEAHRVVDAAYRSAAAGGAPRSL